MHQKGAVLVEVSRQKNWETFIWVFNFSKEFRDRHTALEKGKESESESQYIPVSFSR